MLRKNRQLHLKKQKNKICPHLFNAFNAFNV